jgi:hypothetical protein
LRTTRRYIPQQDTLPWSYLRVVNLPPVSGHASPHFLLATLHRSIGFDRLCWREHPVYVPPRKKRRVQGWPDTNVCSITMSDADTKVFSLAIQFSSARIYWNPEERQS